MVNIFMLFLNKIIEWTSNFENNINDLKMNQNDRSLLDLNCLKEFHDMNGTVIHPNRPKILNKDFDLNGLLKIALSKSGKLKVRS